MLSNLSILLKIILVLVVILVDGYVLPSLLSAPDTMTNILGVIVVIIEVILLYKTFKRG